MRSMCSTTAQQFFFILEVFHEIFHFSCQLLIILLLLLLLSKMSRHMKPWVWWFHHMNFDVTARSIPVNRLYGLIHWILSVHFEFQKCSIRIENYVNWSDHIPSHSDWGFGRNHFSHLVVDRIAAKRFCESFLKKANFFDSNVTIPLKFSLRRNKNEFGMPTNDRK